MSKTMANKFAGTCTVCGAEVAPGAGIAVGTGGGRNRRTVWTVRHIPSRWVGSPVSGRWADGCPAPVAEVSAEVDTRGLDRGDDYVPRPTSAGFGF